MADTIRLQDRDVPFERARLPVDQLKLDPKNPRIQYLIGRQPDTIDQERLEQLLWDKEPVKALSMQIKQNGGVYEAIIVQKVNGNYLVREGNSRTVATKRLKAQHDSDERFAFVPAMIFDHELTQEDLAVLLADMHVTGKIRWDAYEQAKHVHQLYEDYGKTYDWLATHLRLSKSRIAQDLKAYKWTTEYLGENPDPKNLERFAFFQELARKKDLSEQYSNSLEFQQEFKRWLSEGKLTASNQVRKLPMILDHDKARQTLGDDGFEAAATVLIREDPSLGSDLYEAVKKATEKLSKAPADEIQDLSQNKQKLILLRNLNRALKDLATLAEVEL